MSVHTRIKGREVRLKINGSNVPFETGLTLSINPNTEDEKTKDDADAIFDNPEVTSTSYSIKFDGKLDNAMHKTLVDAQLAKTTVAWSIAIPQLEGSVEKTLTLSGDAYPTGVTAEAENKARATYSIDLTGNGKMTVAIA